jgi:hypothetical protein
MTYETIFDEHDDSIELKKLRKENKILKAENEKNEKIIDLLETHSDIKDYEIRTLREKLNEKRKILR